MDNLIQHYTQKYSANELLEKATDEDRQLKGHIVELVLSLGFKQSIADEIEPAIHKMLYSFSRLESLNIAHSNKQLINAFNPHINQIHKAEEDEA